MLEVSCDNDGNIKGCLEWYLVDREGHLDDKGEYVWIQDVYICKHYRNNGVLKEFIRTVTKRIPWAKYGYFKRGKYNDRVHIYTRSKWLKLIKEV